MHRISMTKLSILYMKYNLADQSNEISHSVYMTICLRGLLTISGLYVHVMIPTDVNVKLTSCSNKSTKDEQQLYIANVLHYWLVSELLAILTALKPCNIGDRGWQTVLLMSQEWRPYVCAVLQLTWWLSYW